MADRFVVSLLMLHLGTPRDQQAREQLAAALPSDAEVTAPDKLGVFDVHVDADDFEQALNLVWDAVAASGTDDHIVFLIPTSPSTGGRAARGRRRAETAQDLRLQRAATAVADPEEPRQQGYPVRSGEGIEPSNRRATTACPVLRHRFVLRLAGFAGSSPG